MITKKGFSAMQIIIAVIALIIIIYAASVSSDLSAWYSGVSATSGP